jgi:hypothetical protein
MTFLASRPEELEKKHDVEKGDCERDCAEDDLIPGAIGKLAHHLPGGSEKDQGEHCERALMHLGKDYLPVLPDRVECLIWLTQYSVRVRYPGFSATKRDMKKALSVAKRLRLLIRDFFGLTDGRTLRPGIKNGTPPTVILSDGFRELPWGSVVAVFGW